MKHLRQTPEAGRLELEGDLPLLLQQGNGGQELVPRNLVFVCEGERSFPWTCSQFMMILPLRIKKEIGLNPLEYQANEN